MKTRRIPNPNTQRAVMKTRKNSKGSYEDEEELKGAYC